ncbi:Sporulation protein YpeB [compost metagenome]
MALDDGEILGVQASEYIYSKKERKLEPPVITMEEAKKSLSSNLKVSNHTLAVIKNDLTEEVLCHEFIGSMNSNIYRVYINGETGQEEKIETIRPEDKEAVVAS